MNSLHQLGPITNAEEIIPVFATYLSMVIILMATIIVITPAVMIINVIWWTKELHTKYIFLLAHFLATSVARVIVQSVLTYIIMILYLIDLNSNSIILKWLVISLSLLLYLMVILLPTTLAVERMIVIAFPYHHKNIVTTKTVACMIAILWVLTAILTIIIIIIVPINLV